MENIYYIWGNEDYLIDQTIQSIIAERQEQTSGETEVLYLDAEEMRPQEWAQELEYSPLFQLSRIIVMKRPPWLMNANKKVKDEKLVRDILENYVSHLPQEQILILTAAAKNSTHPIVKLFAKKAAFIECSRLTPKQMEEWIQQQAQKQGCRFEKPDMVRKLATSGQNLYDLDQLIRKLALLSSNGIIPKSLLEDQVEYQQEIKIFKLIDGVLDRKEVWALEALHQLLRQGEAEIYILYMLNRQFTLYAQVKALKEEGKTASEIEKQTGQKTFTVKKMLERVRKYQWNEIEKGLAHLLQTDMELKSSSKPPQILLEMLIIALIEGKAYSLV